MTVFDPLNDKISVYSELLGETSETNAYAMCLRTLMSGGIVTLTPNHATGQMIIDAPNNYFTSIATDGVTMSGNGTAASPLVSLIPPIVISPSSVSTGTIETAYHTSFSATGGSGSGYTFYISAGTLPHGMSLSTSGELTGVPVQFGTFIFTVLASDSWGITGQVSYTLSLASITLLINPTTLSTAYYNSSYSSNLTTSNGTGDDHFSIAAGNLPPGLSLTTGGAITGTPTAIGSWTFSVNTTDSAGDTGSINYTLRVLNNLAITPATLASGSIGTPYAQTLGATGGTGSGYGFSIVAGSLPTGITLSGTSISGTPTSAGTFSFTIQVYDSAGNLKNFPYSITINLVTLAITPTSLGYGSIGYTYAASLYASGGLGSNYTYSISSGSLPTGLSLVGNTISGMVTGTGTFNFTILFSDAAGDTGSNNYSIYVPAVSGGQWDFIASAGYNGDWPRGGGNGAASTGAFNLPQFNWLYIEVWGAGGGGGSDGWQGGTGGGDSSCGPCWAGGGAGGRGGQVGGGGGAGGNASGGNACNTSGGSQSGSNGGNGATGDAGATLAGGGGAYGGPFGSYPSGDQGFTPGGGGGGITGGGGGGYSRQLYYAGQIAPGTNISYTAGGGGNGGDAGTTWNNGTGGGGGQVRITWG